MVSMMEMRETFTAVLYPFLMCAIVGLLSKVKSKEKKTFALIMILAVALDLAMALYLLGWDPRGIGISVS